ncbi:Fibronectin type III domain protein [Limihaloglobus sulfuriphilus]|uniref:Fibronectin type III domain protein n=1 Tax=Limihaloglobus sulfuriphilus TaxID=1851148 RepID=A0A1Q2MHG0_9BACT|nr:right-handed parallel beta-helix repeat-containing protein [Limihaloglobus sulfuriphilus]AQQ72131.1 Fibronectin type III domain protein [Limihaloglobus sulfuriphilus]
MRLFKYFSLLLLTAACLQAKVLQVPTTLYPDIPDAVAAAAPGDTILISPKGDGSDYGPYAISLGDVSLPDVAARENAPVVTMYDGLSGILIDKNLTIEGLGEVVIDCGEMGRAFTIDGSAAGGITVNITNIKIQNTSYAPVHEWIDEEGEILGQSFIAQPMSDGTPIFVAGQLIEGVDPDTGEGTGEFTYELYEVDSFPVPDPDTGDVDFEAGCAYGGAIGINSAEVHISDCEFDNCEVTGARGSQGIMGSYYDMENDRVALRDADGNGFDGGEGGNAFGDGYGGAIGCQNGSWLFVDNTIFSNCAAVGAIGGDGGPGSNAAGNADDGWNGNASNGGDAGNPTGAGNGGAVYLDPTSQSEFTSSELFANECQLGQPGTGGATGGGDVSEDNPVFPGSSGSGFVFYYRCYGGAFFADSEIDEGGMLLNAAWPSFVDTQFKANESPYYGGAIYAGHYVELVISQSDPSIATFDNNTARQGGAIFLHGENVLDVSDCYFSSNNANSGYGGAVYSGDPSTGDDNITATFNRTTFSRNGALFGGAVFTNMAASVDYTQCVFSSNTALSVSAVDPTQTTSHGGALNIKGNVNISDCVMTNNIAGGGNGGAIHALQWSGTLTNCLIKDNQALSGGGIYSMNSAGLYFNNCDFHTNFANAVAGQGGGMAIFDSSDDGSGGDTTVSIRHSEFTANTGSGNGSKGGGLYISTCDNVEIFNTLVNNNTAGLHGGGIGLTYVTATLGNLTIDGNELSKISQLPLNGGASTSANDDDDSGSGLYIEYLCDVQLQNSIVSNNAGISVYLYDADSSFYSNNNMYYMYPVGEYEGYVYDAISLLKTDDEIDSLPGSGGNLTDNPRFTSGPLGYYYLSSNSRAIDAGNDTFINVFGADAPTYEGDEEIVDLGYHYPAEGSVPQYTLTINQVENAIITPVPNKPTYFSGELVELNVTLETGWRVRNWLGTINDTSNRKTNYVLMNTDKTVSVVIERPVIRHVPAEYPVFRAALKASDDYDIIMVAQGTHYIEERYVIDRELVITSTNPDNPEVVAGTVFVPNQPQGTTRRGAFDFYNVSRDTVFQGFTVRNFQFYGTTPDHRTSDVDGEDGGDGSGAAGGAFTMQLASPQVKNTVFENCGVTGGDGQNGESGIEEHPNGGEGGWAGPAYGGAVFMYANCSPRFENCSFADCYVQGGNGGNGGAGWVSNGRRVGAGGLGGSWGDYDDYGYPDDMDHDVGARWENQPSGIYFAPNSWYENPEMYNWRDRAGKGGAVFISNGSNPEFDNCTFENNNATSGLTGVTALGPGDSQARPTQAYRIEAFGGAVYAETNSKPSFIECQFDNNTTNKDFPEGNYHEYVSRGGALYFEDGCVPLMDGCVLSGNDSCLGGGVYTEDSELVLIDSSFVNNTAYIGGGLVNSRGATDIFWSSFDSNHAMFDPPSAQTGDDDEVTEDSDLFAGNGGSGGGIYNWEADMEVIGTQLLGNEAGASGGGFFSGGGGSPILQNVLVARNNAGSSGGGLSLNHNTTAQMFNLTVADNSVTSTVYEDYYGGGLYLGYESTADVKDSIFWGNQASTQYGQQIAVGLSNEFIVSPSILTISNSIVEAGQGGVYTDIGDPVSSGDDSILIWDEATMLPSAAVPNAQPLFTSGELGDYYLSRDGMQYEDYPVQTGTSPAIDIGSRGFFDAELYRYSNRTDHLLDTNVVDAGFYYTIETDIKGDINYDGLLSLSDILELSRLWLEEGCVSPLWCYDRDVNQDGYVDYFDWVTVAASIGGSDTEAPMPNPMAWIQPPFSLGGDAVEMECVEALDNATAVEYYFECVNAPEFSSGWVEETVYTVTGLPLGEIMSFRVRARDFNGNETANSTVAYLTVGADRTPPTPNPLTWLLEPVSSSATSVMMTTVEARDSSGYVEYQFECLEEPDFNSSWIQVNSYQFTELEEGQTYTFRARARDAFGNVTNYTSEVTVIAGGDPDNGIPADGAPPMPNPLNWLYDSFISTDSYATIVSELASDLSGSVEYFFDCKVDEDATTGLSPHDSGWIASNVFTPTTLEEGMIYSYVVRARDAFGNETLDSELAYISIGGDSEAPTPNPPLWSLEPVSASVSSIVMSAEEGYDPSNVLYFFECMTDSTLDSGWQQNRSYAVNGLGQGQTYSFRFKMRDAFGNETEYSSEKFATVSEDFAPPLPTPMEWLEEPYLLGENRAVMSAVFATDSSSAAQYYFDCVEDDAFDSGWISSNIYFVNIQNDVTLTFRVKARDLSENMNETGFSEEASVTGSADFYPPAPDPLQWEQVPVSGSPTSVLMSTVEARDSSGEVEYYFECVTNEALDSGWQSSRVYSVEDLVEGQTYGFRARARDKYGNMTAYTNIAFASPGLDEQAPLPNPLGWRYDLFVRTTASALIAADFAYDVNGPVEYYFACVEDPNLDSGWTLDNLYEVTDIDVGSIYHFTVVARDALGNTGQVSEEAIVVIGDDVTAPTPDPLEWLVEPTSASNSSIAMSVSKADDPSGVEYFFECIDDESYDSGWIANPFYEVRGLDSGDTLSFRARARDLFGNMTDYTPTVAATVTGDLAAPMPNPMEWFEEPYLQNDTTVSMAAKYAQDSSSLVEYYFDCIEDDAFDYGWIDANVYTAYDLILESKYTFRVKARDAFGNETEWSDEVSVIATDDLDPPLPDPAEWFEDPIVDMEGLVSMEAGEATDDNGPVEYLFECVNNELFSSDWQSETLYEIEGGLTAGIQYEFRFRARDRYGNMTDWSESRFVTYVIDNVPPTPGEIISAVDSEGIANESGRYHTITATLGSDNNTPIYYQLICEDFGGEYPDGFSSPILQEGENYFYDDGYADMTVTFTDGGVTFRFKVRSTDRPMRLFYHLDTIDAGGNRVSSETVATQEGTVVIEEGTGEG